MLIIVFLILLLVFKITAWAVFVAFFKSLGILVSIVLTISLVLLGVGIVMVYRDRNKESSFWDNDRESCNKIHQKTKGNNNNSCNINSTGNNSDINIESHNGKTKITVNGKTYYHDKNNKSE